jgi:hypothetical protein
LNHPLEGAVASPLRAQLSWCAALVLYMTGLVIKVSNGEANWSMIHCGVAFAVVMLPALAEAKKVMTFLTIS